MGDSNPTSSSASSPEGILARDDAHPPGGAAPVAPTSTTRLYDRTYAGFELDARQQVRLDTYGEDLGQNSWLTADEWREIIGWTALGQGSVPSTSGVVPTDLRCTLPSPRARKSSASTVMPTPSPARTPWQPGGVALAGDLPAG
jgi:hypothetical protein